MVSGLRADERVWLLDVLRRCKAALTAATA